MGSFIALHVENCHDETLLQAVSAWLAPFGFEEAEPFEGIPEVLQKVRFSVANGVGVERLNDSWHILVINSFTLGGVPVDEVAVRPLTERLAARAVLFSAQTTSDVYQLAVFDLGKCVRCIASSEGQLLKNIGPLLPGERRGAFSARSASHDEESPSEMEDATTICAALGFELWRTPPIRGPGHHWRRRGFLSRLLRR